MSILISPVFTHCPLCGLAGLARTEPAAYDCKGCGFHYHINPAIGVGAIIQDFEGRILLLRRAKEPAKGMLSLPGGFVDMGETAEEALTREIHEETGLEVNTFQYLASFPNKYPYRGVTYRVLDFFYTCRVETFDSVQTTVEVDDFCIMRPKDIYYEFIAFESIRFALELFCRQYKSEDEEWCELDPPWLLHKKKSR